jgi:DNA-binding XRE family transcriptional regulator
MRNPKLPNTLDFNGFYLNALCRRIILRNKSVMVEDVVTQSFDTLSHEWLVKFIEHRIGDRRIIRLIQKWLKAGVLEEGKRVVKEEGTVQGGSISPVLANIYLYYVFDLWAHRWRRKQARGEVYLMRFADDVVAGFQHQHEAEEFLEDLKQRFSKFALQLHPEKTRLIEFGRFAAENRRNRGEGKPETFNFLGFTHICGKTRSEKLVKAQREALQSQLSELKWQLDEYDKLRSGKLKSLKKSSFQNLPIELIRVRIARGLTQKDLAMKLGVKEQQIQRYEETDYASASLSRLNEVIKALDIEVMEEITLG